MSFLVRCEQVSKHFHIKYDREASSSFIPNSRIVDDTFIALEDVSFDLNEGDRLGIIGLNGAGKSTLLKIISGIIKPTKGSITINGRITPIIEPGAFFIQEFTGLENIRLLGRLLGLKSDEIKRKIDDIIEFSELGEFIHQPVKNYSTGMSLRLSFAIFKEFRPEVLLLDEILSAGDVIFREKIRLSFKKMFSEVAGIILVSHQFYDIYSYCNKCLVLNNGKVEFLGDTEKAVAYYNNTNITKTQVSKSNEFIIVNDVSFTQKKTEYAISETIGININYTKRKEDGVIDPLINISNASGPVMTDCPLYRSDFERTNQPAGTYNYYVEIPAYILNKGQYYMSIVFGRIDSDVMELPTELIFEIVPDEWELGQKWNIAPQFPVRPHLKWEMAYGK